MIYTSYFAIQKNNPNTVAICRGIPAWFKGPSYQALAPSWSILKEWKESAQDTEAIAHYTKRYQQEVLAHLDPERIYQDLNHKTLLCYEKREDFCHRHLVAQWLQANGYDCQEL